VAYMDETLHSVSLRLAYKGERDYLHGTDIYNAVTGIIGGSNPGIVFNRIKIAFHKVARNQCKLIYGNYSLLEQMPKNINVEVNYISSSANIIGWLCETDEHVIEHIPYQEEEIIKRSNIDGKKITIDSELQFTPIEVLVAMTKQLHVIHYPVKTGRWFFARIDLNRLLTISDAQTLVVEIEKNLNNRLTKARIHSGEEMLGYIYFSLVTL
jgi:hypothetical protein